MQIIHKTLPRKHKLFLAGDFHIGSLQCNLNRIEELIRTIQCEKDNYVILMGDQVEAIAYNDPRYDGTNPYNPLEQMNIFIDMFEPIKDRIIAILDGNHEAKLRPFGLVTRDIQCKALDAEYGTSSCVVALEDDENNLMYRVYCHHGFNSTNPKSPSYLMRETRIKEWLKSSLREKCGDAVIMALGHVHKLIVYPPQESLCLATTGNAIKSSYVIPKAINGGYIHPDFRWYVGTGSFLKQYSLGHSSYSEMAGYDPVDLGYAVVNVRDSYPQEVERVVV